MSEKEKSSSTGSGTPTPGTVDTKLEVVVIPVSDVDQAKAFYESLGWRLDVDRVDGEFRGRSIHADGLLLFSPIRRQPHPG